MLSDSEIVLQHSSFTSSPLPQASIFIQQICQSVLLLLLSIFILYLGLQQWRQHHSFTTTSHSDIFTYHMATMELIWGLGSGFFFCDTSSNLPEMMIVGYCLSSIILYGEIFFHLLTCVERYLAVVHPITYLGLKNARGVRIRNISIGCVWLLCFIWSGGTVLLLTTLRIFLLFCFLVFSLVVISFCSLSVLRVLIRPGPGEVGWDKEWVDQWKQREFLTIMAVMRVLWLWFGGILVSYALDASPQLSPNVGCVVKTSAFWSSLSSSLVSPLSYLLRAGKLPCYC